MVSRDTHPAITIIVSFMYLWSLACSANIGIEDDPIESMSLAIAPSAMLANRLPSQEIAARAMLGLLDP